MNVDDSSGPNNSAFSMPDHSRGDFHSYSVDKSSAIPSPANRSPHTSVEYNKRGNVSPRQYRPDPASPNFPQSHGASVYSDLYQTSNYQGGQSANNTWLRDPYEENNNSRPNNRSSRDPERTNNRDAGRDSNPNNEFSPFSNEEESDVEVDQNYKTFLQIKRVYIFYIFPILVVVLLGINIYFAYSTDKTRFPFLEEVDSQFSSHPIIDMSLVEKTSNCSGLYTNVKMGIWPGYESLCQCESSVSEGACSEDQLKNKCQTVRPLNPIKLHFWDGKTICIRKSEGSIRQYYQKLSTNANGDTICEDDLKKCVISTNDNAICMGKYEFCPVTKIITNDVQSDDPNVLRWKGQLKFKDKTLLFENEVNKGTALLDIDARYNECAKSLNESCNQTYAILDSATEFEVVKDNTLKADKYEVIKGLDKSIALHGQPASYLEMCKFNKTFNPTILNSELGNWDRVKTLRFVNPFFFCSLLLLNFVRTSVLEYLNTKTAARTLIRRKRELYNVFGFFTGSSVMITCEVLIILYYIFWGYLLLNQSRMIGQRWLDMSCIGDNIRSDIQQMMSEISKVEAYNMITIGPVIVCCILEALFAQYKLIGVEAQEQLRD